MAYSSSSPSLLFSLLLVSLFISLSSAMPTMTASTNLINSICSTTQNPPLCLQVLKSDPRTASADLVGLARITINISLIKAKQTLALIVSFSRGVTNPKLKDQYNTCAENYGDAIAELNEARLALNAKDIGTFQTKASAALDGPETCEDSFGGSPAEPALLKQANKKVEGIVSIVLAVGARLGGSN